MSSLTVKEKELEHEGFDGERRVCDLTMQDVLGAVASRRVLLEQQILRKSK